MFRSFGERFNLNNPYPQKIRKRTTKEVRQEAASSSRTLHLKIDILFFMSVIVLMVIGLIVVYSSSYDFSTLYFDESGYIFYRQIFVMLLGVIGMAFLAFFDYHNLKRFVLFALLGTIGALFLVLLIGEQRHGAARSLFSGSIQPSEFAKLAVILYLAVWLYAKQDTLNKISFGLLPMGIILGVMSGFVFLQPDISAVFTIMFIGIIMFILAGGDLKQIGMIAAFAALGIWATITIFPTGNARMQEFISGFFNPSQSSYHVLRAIEAFVKGGWVGVGLGNSTTKLLGLPVPHTDSAYAVIGEEMGMVGAVSLLALFTILLWRGLLIARKAPDMMGALLAGGLSIWIAFEAFINMAGIINVLPFAGNALPFISAGGSSLFVSLLAIGIILNVSRQSVVSEEEKGKVTSEAVDLRRRDRRGSVPRARRDTSIEKDE